MSASLKGLLLFVAALLYVSSVPVAHAHGNVPGKSSLPAAKITEGPPRARAAPVLSSAPQIVVAAPVYEKQAGVYEADAFPAEAPKRPKLGDAPLPLSTPGRYLHTSVVIGNKMYVYGGISAYSNQYFNDAWLYSVGDDQWNQLQGNFIPPLPRNGGLGLDSNPDFKPADIPTAPALETSPNQRPGLSTALLNAEGAPVNPLLPHLKAQRPVRVVALPPIHAKQLSATDAAKARAEGRVKDGHLVFLQTEEHLDLSHSSRIRNKLRQRLHTATSQDGGEETANAATEDSSSSSSTINSGSYYAQPYPRPSSIPHTIAAGAETHSSVHPLRGQNLPPVPYDFWELDIDSKEWHVVDVATSKPNPHNFFTSPQTINDPVFKDPNPALLPPSRRLHTAVVIREKMVVFGGVSYNNIILGDVWVFDPEAKSWVEANPDTKAEGAAPILPREGHTAIVGKTGTDMYIFGGVSYGFMPFNDLWVYNAADNVWKRLQHHTSAQDKVPLARWLHTAVYDPKDDQMVVFGGVTAGHVPLNDVWFLNMETLEWTTPAIAGIPPFPRMMHTATLMKRLMFVQGGAANNLPMDDVWVLDLEHKTWKEILPAGPYPFARVGATAVLLSPAYSTMAANDPANANRHATAADLAGLAYNPNEGDDDVHDAHLQWTVSSEEIDAKPVVGSFSNEGVDNGSGGIGNPEALKQIADPQNVHTAKSGIPVRPLFRYRKHPINNFWILVFGGATAQAAPAAATTPATTPAKTTPKPAAATPATKPVHKSPLKKLIKNSAATHVGGAAAVPGTLSPFLQAQLQQPPQLPGILGRPTGFPYGYMPGAPRVGVAEEAPEALHFQAEPDVPFNPQQFQAQDQQVQNSFAYPFVAPQPILQQQQPVVQNPYY